MQHAGASQHRAIGLVVLDLHVWSRGQSVWTKVLLNESIEGNLKKNYSHCVLIAIGNCWALIINRSIMTHPCIDSD